MSERHPPVKAIRPSHALPAATAPLPQHTTIPSERIAIDPLSGCWVWQGAVSEEGYGIVTIAKKRLYVHRVMFQMFVGPVGKGYQLDHLCRNTTCCNPWHLEAVSPYENSIRGSHPLYITHRERRCRRGHDLTNPENVRKSTDGRTRCRICARANRAAYKAKKKGLAS